MFSSVNIKHNIIANLTGRVWSSLMSFIFLPFYIQFLGMEAFGLVGIYTSLTVIFSVLDMGLSMTLNRELARLATRPGTTKDARDLVRTLEYIYWGTGVLIGIVIIALAPWIAQYWVKLKGLTVETVTQAIVLQGVLVGLRWPIPLYSGGLMGLQRQVLLNTLNAGIATLQGTGSVLVLWLISPTIQAFFLWQTVVAIAQIILFPICLWRLIPAVDHRPAFSQQWLITIWRFAAGMTGITVTSIILTQLDKILLSKFLDLETFGYYTLAVSIAAVLSFAAQSFYFAVYPVFSQRVAAGQIESLITLYHKSCQSLSIILFPVGFMVVLFSKELLSCYVINPVVVEHTYILLSMIIFGNMLNSIMVMPYALQLGYGWTRLSVYKNVIAVALVTPLLIFMVARYGAIGAAMVWVLLNVGYILIEVPVMHSRVIPGEKWKWYSMDIGYPLIISGLIIGFARFIIPQDGFRLPTLPWVIFAAFLASGVSALVLPYSREWIRNILKGLIPNE